MKTHVRIGWILVLLALSLSSQAAIRVWDGGGADANWSTAANWAGDVAPLAGDELVFPQGAARLTNQNDTALTYASIVVERGYVLQGNVLTLTAGIEVVTDTGVVRIECPVSAPVAQTFNVAATLHLSGGVALGNEVTFSGFGTYVVDSVIDGPGSIVLAGNARVFLERDNTYTGGTTITGGTLFANDPPGGTTATFKGVTLLGGALAGTGSTRDVSLNGFAQLSGGTVDDPDLATENLVFGPDNTLALVLLTPTVAQQIDVAGPVTLNGAALSFVSEVPPPPGSQFTIIDNDGADPVVGTFAGFPEGALLELGGRTARITYVGGDGNDIVVSAVTADLSVAKTADDMAPTVGDNVTFSVVVSNAGPNAATGVTLTDTLPAGLQFVSAAPDQGTCTGTGPVVCALGTIASGATAHVSIVARVTANGPLTNSARVTATETDPTPGNDSGSVTITAQAPGPSDVPALDLRGLAALAVLLVLAGAFVLRH